MDELDPLYERCLTPDERRELEQTWRDLQTEMQSFGKLVEQADEIDCDQLHDAFLRLADVFDEVERVVMRAKQFRLRYATPDRDTTD